MVTIPFATSGNCKVTSSRLEVKKIFFLAMWHKGFELLPNKFTILKSEKIQTAIASVATKHIRASV